MADKTGIEWTDATWNPIRGCSRVSEGCRHCYAEGVAHRFSGPGLPYEGLTTLGKWNGTIKFVEEHLLDPLKWKTPRRIFVNSMSDLFHDNVTDGMLDRIFAVMALCPQHTFQILTKRPERMLAYLTVANVMGGWGYYASQILHKVTGIHDLQRDMAVAPTFPLPNVWLGVSVESDKHRDRIDVLRQTPAAVRFLSCEPVIADLSLRWLCGWDKIHPRHLNSDFNIDGRPISTDELDGLRELDWVICGGESGPGARPMHPDWARSLRDQCVAAGVPFFFKQWGEFAEVDGDDPVTEHDVEDEPLPNQTGNVFVAIDGHVIKHSDEMKVNIGYRWMSRIGKKAAGDLLDGVQWHQFPEVAR